MKIIPKNDLFIVLIVFVLTVSWSLLYATAIGFVIASIFFMKKMADTIDQYSKGSNIDPVSERLINLFDDSKDFKKDVYIKQLNGPLFFGFASRIEKGITDIPNVKTLILDMKNVPYVDQTGLYSLRDALDDLNSRNVEVYLTGMNNDVFEMLEGINVFPELVPFENIYNDLETCVLWIHDKKDPRLHDENIGIHIPSAITPNKDGKNDEWVIHGLEKFQECMVAIRDDKDVPVFTSKGYGQPWDGTINEKPLPPGKYGYTIELFSNKNMVYEGFVNLVR